MLNNLLKIIVLRHSGEDGGEAGGGEASAPSDAGGGAGGAAPAGGDLGGAPAGGSEFSWSSWDGNSDSVPESHREAYSAIQNQFNKSNAAKVGESLAQNLRDRHARQRQAAAAAAQQNRSQGDGDGTLTRAQLDAELKQREHRRIIEERTNAFRTGMEQLVSAPQQFGGASIAFSSQEEVGAFENWMRDKFNNGLSPNEMLKLYKHDQILKAHGEHSVREFEKKLGSRGRQIRDGGRIEPGNKTENNRVNQTGESDGRVASLEDFLKEENPAAHRAIKAGQINPLDHI